MTNRKLYEATAERDGRFWFIRVDELDAATQARRLEQADEMVRDLIAIKTGKDPDSFDVDIRPVLNGGLQMQVAKVLVARGKAAAAQAEVFNSLRETAQKLSEAGLTVRDAGIVLGVSHQRVAQLLASVPEDTLRAAAAGIMGDARRVVESFEPEGRRTTTVGEALEHAQGKR